MTTLGYSAPTDARLAASLLLLRDGEAGIEVLMLRRAERDNDIRSGAAVFPGGVLDARDREAHAHCVGADDAGMSRLLGLAEGGLDYAVAALRECFEEVGLLLADRALDVAPLAAWRHRLHAGEIGAADLCRALGFSFDLRGLHYWSHWLTPPGTNKRFDTRFFVARAPEGQEAVPDLGETVELMWLTPAAALEPARGLKLLPVTRRTLQELTRFASVEDVLAHARTPRQITRTMPRHARTAAGPRVVLPDELPYAEVARLDPEGRGDAFCDIVPGRAVQLSARVRRVTAPNAGVMTGPGTNSYIVGDARGCCVIDPGPADAAHLQALRAALPGPLERILVTHTHVDHSPGARALAEATGAPVLGRVADFPNGQDATFRPTQALAGGERLPLPDGAALRAIHTPGHASNHLCYLLEAEKTLFTGDHVMQGSTVVINPPDGDMAAYLRALEALLAEDIEWFAPGHGWLVAEPKAVLRGLMRHRLAREAKVRAALQSVGEGDVEALLPKVYDDVPLGLHPVAARSLLAHLIKLRGDGEAVENGKVWRYAGGG